MEEIRNTKIRNKPIFLMVTDYKGGRTWFDEHMSPARCDETVQNDIVIEFFRWKQDDYRMLWVFVLSKFGFGIVGCDQLDEYKVFQRMV